MLNMNISKKYHISIIANIRDEALNGMSEMWQSIHVSAESKF